MEVARKLGADPPARALPMILAWARSVVEWRDRAQLTSHRSVPAVVDALMTTALYAIPHLALSAHSVVVDLGAGSGCTAVSLSAALGAGTWVLVDRSETKVTFCRYAIRKCGTLRMRATAAAEDPGPGTADVVLARGLPAVKGSDESIARWGKPGGMVLRWEPGPPTDEGRPSVRCGSLAVWVTATDGRFT